MRKYWLVFTNSVATMLTYRVNLLWELGSHCFAMLIIYLLWSTLLKNGFGADHYSQSSLILYYLAMTFVGNFIHYDYHLAADDVRLGNLSADLIRPYNYYLKLFIEGLAGKLLVVLLFVPIFLPLIKPNYLVIFLVTLTLALIIRFLIMLTIGGLAFWFNRVHGFNAAIFSIGGLFSGEMIPSDLLPEKLQLVGNLLPFKYSTFVPAKYLSGNASGENLLANFLMQIFWIIIWLLIVKVIWQKGLKRYESAGQ